MANPNFSPNFSTNDIYRDLDMGRCLSDDLDALENGKAPTDHQHSGYASANHTHNDYASENHTHTEYASNTHAHTEYAQTNHGHSYNDVNCPQMLFGEEYLTNEMWNGQPLYTTLIDCGTFARNTAVQTEITCSRIVRYTGRTGDCCLPFIHSTFDNAYSCWLTVLNNNSHIKIAMYGGANSGTAATEVQVWYTKPTN